jgi:hypothetical protein
VTPQPVTDQAIDALIEASRDNLRAAIRAAVEKLAPVHLFEIAKVPLQSGQQWNLVIAVMLEPMAGLVGATMLQGVPAMMAAYEKMQVKPVPFSIPGA